MDRVRELGDESKPKRVGYNVSIKTDIEGEGEEGEEGSTYRPLHIPKMLQQGRISRHQDGIAIPLHPNHMHRLRATPLDKRPKQPIGIRIIPTPKLPHNHRLVARLVIPVIEHLHECVRLAVVVVVVHDIGQRFRGETVGVHVVDD